MAEVTFIAPVAKIEGKLNQKDKTVFRKKVARDDQGRVIAEMKQEVYVVQHPRDWKKNPAKGAEKLKQDRWAEACAKTKAILEKLKILWSRTLKNSLCPKNLAKLLNIIPNKIAQRTREADTVTAIIASAKANVAMQTSHVTNSEKNNRITRLRQLFQKRNNSKTNRRAQTRTNNITIIESTKTKRVRINHNHLDIFRA